MITCIGIFHQHFNRVYALYDTKSKQSLQLRDYELVSSIQNGMQVQNLQLDTTKNPIGIKGKGIDTEKLDYFNINKITVIGVTYNDKQEVIGYDTIDMFGNTKYINKDTAKESARWNRATNLVYVESGDYVKLLSTEGIEKRTLDKKTEEFAQYKMMDTSWDTKTEDTIKMFLAHGFKVGYKKDYKYKTKFDNEVRALTHYILYDKNNNIVIIDKDIDAKGLYNKLSGYGGYLVTQSLNINNMSKTQGNTGVEKSKYEKGIEFRYESFDIREYAIKSYKEVLEIQEPVDYLYDSAGRMTYYLILNTRDMEEYRTELTEKYFGDDDLKGYGFENYIFLIKEYKNFSPELQKCFKFLYEHAYEMLYNEIASDATEYSPDALKLNKTNFKKLIMLITELATNYGIQHNWEEPVLRCFEENRRIKEEKVKEQKRQMQERKKQQGNIMGGFGLMGMFRR